MNLMNFLIPHRSSENLNLRYSKIKKDYDPPIVSRSDDEIMPSMEVTLMKE